MRRSTVTTCTCRVRTPVLSLGPPPRSSRPQWLGLGTFGGGDEAQEDEDMADMLDFLLWGVTVGSPNLWFVFIWTLLFFVILLFFLWFDIIAFGYFVIYIVIWHYCFHLFFYFCCHLTLSASSYYVHSDWTEHAIIAFSYLLLIVSNFTASSILSYVLCDG